MLTKKEILGAVICGTGLMIFLLIIVHLLSLLLPAEHRTAIANIPYWFAITLTIIGFASCAGGNRIINKEQKRNRP